MIHTLFAFLSKYKTCKYLPNDTLLCFKDGSKYDKHLIVTFDIGVHWDGLVSLL